MISHQGRSKSSVLGDDMSRSLKVLIADDCPDMLARVRVGLVRRGYEVVMANSPQAAIACLKSARDQFCAVVTDFDFCAEENGVDVAHQVKKHLAFKHSVIMMSANTPDEIIKRVCPKTMDYIDMFVSKTMKGFVSKIDEAIVSSCPLRA